MKPSDGCLVLRGRNGLYDVEMPAVEGSSPASVRTLACRAGSKIRKDGWKLSAGDRVTVDDNGDGTGFIREILPRSNSLIRPPVANIGLLVIVVSATEPAPNLFTIDKLTVAAEHEKIPVAIAVTKCELGSGESLAEVYRRTPYPVFLLSHGGKEGAKPLLDAMNGKITVFTGASGVGKSTLINTLFPSVRAEVGGLSERIMRGKNTTRVTSLHRVAEGTYLADTPGFTSLDITRYAVFPKEELAPLFPEFRPHLTECRYTHCTHLCEEGCGVLKAIGEGTVSPSRQESYSSLYRELKAHPVYLKRSEIQQKMESEKQP